MESFIKFGLIVSEIEHTDGQTNSQYVFMKHVLYREQITICSILVLAVGERPDPKANIKRSPIYT